MTKRINKKRNENLIMDLKLSYMALLLIVLVLASTSVLASGLSNARAIGMAGAYSSLARGYDCPSFNPANLALKDISKSGFQLVGFGAAISNNSFSLDDYNNYTGATLTESDKNTLLDKIPTEGLKLSVDVEASAMSFGFGNFAFSMTGYAAADINLSREVAELLLNGNTIADTINLDATYGEGFGVGSANFSYGRTIYAYGDRQLAVGATFKYLRGFGYEEITHLNGEVVTLPTGFVGAGSVTARTALGGSGYGLDVGSVLRLTKKYTVGVTVSNLLSNITWNTETEEHRYSFDFDTLTAGNMSNDDIISSSDTTIGIASFSSKMPVKIRVGFARTTGKLIWAVDWEQGFKKAAGTSPDPQISAGGEYRLISFLPLRAGFGVGGKRGTTYAGGFGLDFSFIYLDLAIANYNAISGSSGKGLNFGFNIGIGL